MSGMKEAAVSTPDKETGARGRDGEEEEEAFL